MAYKLKFASKRDLGSDYVVPPLEGLWWIPDARVWDFGDKSDWNWTLMLACIWLVVEFKNSSNLAAAYGMAARCYLQRRGFGWVGDREHEIADLLRYMKQQRIRNVVWITADVHYCAAHHYDPSRAKFTDFLPFWEFVAGPLHAITGGAVALDSTFGPEERFNAAPRGLKTAVGPAAGLGRRDARGEPRLPTRWSVRAVASA